MPSKIILSSYLFFLITLFRYLHYLKYRTCYLTVASLGGMDAVGLHRLTIGIIKDGVQVNHLQMLVQCHLVDDRNDLIDDDRIADIP